MVGMFFLSVVTLRGQMTLPFVTDFEPSDGYQLGPLQGQSHWNSPMQVSVDDSNSYLGTQSLLFELGSEPTFLEESFFGTVGATVFVNFRIKPSTISLENLPSSLPSPTAALTAFVENGTNAEVYVVDGKDAEGLIWVPTGHQIPITGSTADNWLHLTYRLDYDSKSYDLLIDDNAIVADLLFIDPSLSAFSQFKIGHDGEAIAYFDALSIDYDNPLFLDADGDLLSDSFERQTSTGRPNDYPMGVSNSDVERHSDDDGDGLTALEEAILETRGDLFDTDGDHIYDLFDERLIGGNGAKMFDALNLSTVPFASYFLNGAELPSNPANPNNWEAFGPASAFSVASEGATASSATSLAITTSGESVELSNLFNGSGLSEVWVDFYLRNPALMGVPFINDTTSAAFYVDSNGDLVAFDGKVGDWVSLTTHPSGLASYESIPSNEFVRFTLYLDYDNADASKSQASRNQNWSIWRDGLRYGQELGFANNVPQLTEFLLTAFSQANANLDDVTVSISEPAGLDNDGDLLPNQFEDAYFSATARNNADSNNDGTLDGYDDLDDDGWIGLEEARFSTNPNIANVSTLPFIETFDTYGYGTIEGTNNWRVFSDGGGAETQDLVTVDSSPRSLELYSPPSGISTILRNTFSDQGKDIVYNEFYHQPRLVNANTPPNIEVNTTVAFYCGDDGNIHLFNGNTQSWESYSAAQPIVENQFYRFGVGIDYTKKEWTLFVDGERVAFNIGFANAERDTFREFRVTHFGNNTFSVLDSIDFSGFVDGVDFTQYIPASWVVMNLGSYNQFDPSADADSDQLNNRDEYFAYRQPLSIDYSNDFTVYYVNDDVATDDTLDGRAPVNESTSGPRKTINTTIQQLSSTTDQDVIVVIENATGYTLSNSTLDITGRDIVLRPVGNVVLK